MNFPPFTSLTTERLLLRELRPDDAQEIFLLRSDAQVNEFVDRKRATSIDGGRQFIRRIIKMQKNREVLMWGIALKDDLKLIGTIVYWNIEPEKDKAEIGYELLPQWHGKGLMQEALLKVIEFGFKTLQIRTIVADPKPANQRSINLLDRCGFVKSAITDDGYLHYTLSAGRSRQQ
jgi:[ribosomal protein S5]-alanine N-acetyltransferase